jgi:hypothetical protein
VFGEGSAQIQRATLATQKNALAFLGLAQEADGSFVSLSEYTSGITASRLGLEKIIQDITAFESTLLSLEFSVGEAAEAIDLALNQKVTEYINNFADNIANGLAVLKDPSQAAVLEFLELSAATRELEKQSQGLFEGVMAEFEAGTTTAENLETATQALADAQEFGTLRLAKALEEYSIAGLKALLASEKVTDEVERGLIQKELETKIARENFEATQRFVSALNDFNKRIQDITGSVSSALFLTNLTSLTDVMTILGETEASDFARSLTDSVNAIQATGLSAESVSNSLALLNSKFEAGEISQAQYSDSLILVSDTALSAIEQQKDAINTLEQELEDARLAFNSSLTEVQRAITGIKDELVGLVESIDESTNSIFEIYDATLADVASSGNELFDLRDSAREAFKASADAVSEFEKANSISGKSAAQIRDEISGIQQNIDNFLSGGSVNLEAFRQLSELSARQNALKRELSNVISVENEYSALIEEREQASKDLAFAEAAVLELGDNLIDTRINESETIKQVMSATKEFVNAQKDLEEITVLLAENNFDLNQIRKDENQRVREVSAALINLDNDLASLEATIGEILTSTELQTNVENAAIELGNAIARNLELEEDSIEWGATVQEKVQEVTQAFEQGLIPLANTINTIFDFNLSNITGISEEFSILSTQSNSLTSKFSEFSTDLVKYLDTEGLSQFYGPGGVFSKFRDGLFSTLVVNGFDILTAAGGPLEGFQVSAVNIQSALIDLASVGANTIVSVEGASTALTSLVQVIGSGANGLTTAINSLLTVGDLTTQTVQDLQGSIGGLYINLSSLNNLNITFDAGEEFDNIINSVTTFNAELGDITITTNLDSVYNDIKNQVLAYNSNLGDIQVVVNASDLANRIATDIVAYNSTLENISVLANADALATQAASDITSYNNAFSGVTVDVDPNALAQGIVTAIKAYNSTFSDINVTANASNIAGDIVTDILAYDSKFEGITVNANAENLGGQIATDIVGYNSKFDNISVNVDAEQLAAGIITAVTGYNSEFEGIQVNNRASALAGSIITDVKAYNSSISSVEVITAAENLGNDIKTTVIAYNSAISAITVDTSANTVAGNILSDVSVYNSIVGSISISAASSVASKIVNDVNTYKSTVGTISVSVANTAAQAISTDITAYKSTIGTISVNVANSAAQAISTDISAYSSKIGTITISNELSTISNTLVAQIKTFYSEIDTIIISNDLLTINSNLVTQIETFYSDIGSINVNNTLNTITGDLIVQIANFYSTVGFITVNNTLNTVTGDLTLQITNFYSTVGSINVNSSLNTVTGDLVTQINNFYSIVNTIITNTRLNSVTGTVIGQVSNYFTSMDSSYNSRNSRLSNTTTYIIDQVNTYFINMQTAYDSRNYFLASLDSFIRSQVNNFFTNMQTTYNNRSDVLNTLSTTLREQITGFYSSIGSIQTTNSLSSLRTTIQTAVDNLFSAFNLTQVSKLETLNSALRTFGLRANDLNAANAALSTFVATNGNINAIKTVWQQIIADLRTEWAKVNLSITKIPSVINVTSSAPDYTAVLNSIKTNSSKAPIIKQIGAAGYQKLNLSTFATGGYVDGPGTSTSDSITANLSKGEYVLRAQAVNSLGLNLLEELNQNGDLASALSKRGRRGDSLVAHINTAEAQMLRRMGGSGTFNPHTGFIEFFSGGISSSVNAYGGLFKEQEVTKLHEVYRSFMSNSLSKLLNPWTDSSFLSPRKTLNIENTVGSEQSGAKARKKFLYKGQWNYGSSFIYPQSGANPSNYNLWPYDDNMTLQSLLDAASQTAAVHSLANKALKARNIPTIGFFENNYGIRDRDPNNRAWIDSKPQPSLQGAGRYLNARPEFNLRDIATNRVGAPLDRNPSYGFTRDTSVLPFITSLNSKNNGMFYDFYMLGNNLSFKKPTILQPFLDAKGMRNAYSTGGPVKGQRDSMPAMLEPGEFVLRKAAVNRMGLDAAVQLNSTGRVDSDTNVEVNVINNGTAQQPVSEPVVRRENGKIIVDVILEDIRNNGPIKRTIRSIR